MVELRLDNLHTLIFFSFPNAVWEYFFKQIIQTLSHLVLTQDMLVVEEMAFIRSIVF